MRSLLPTLLLIAYSTAFERHFSPIDAQLHHISRRWADPKGSELNLNPGNPVHAGIQPQVFAPRPIRAVASQREEEVRHSLEEAGIRQRRHDVESRLNSLEARESLEGGIRQQRFASNPVEESGRPLEEGQIRASRDVRQKMNVFEEVMAIAEQEPRPSRAADGKRPIRNAVGMQGRINGLEKEESRPSRDVKKELSSLEEAVQDSIDLDRSLDRPVRSAERSQLVKKGADRQTRSVPNMAPIQARHTRSSFSSPNNNEGSPGSIQTAAKSLRGERHAPIQHRVVREMENWSHVNPSQPDGVMQHRQTRTMEHFRPAADEHLRLARKDIWKAGMMDVEERTRRMVPNTHIGIPVHQSVEERTVRHVASSRFMPISPQNGKRSTDVNKLGMLDHQGQGA